MGDELRRDSENMNVYAFYTQGLRALCQHKIADTNKSALMIL